MTVLKTRSENEGQRWAGEPSVCPAAVLTQCTKRHFILFVTQKFFPMTRLLFWCHYNYMTHGRGPQQILSHSALLGCSGQCSEPTAVINKSSHVKENSLMSKLNKYYAWKHVSLIKHKKPINDSFLSVYLLICKSFFSPQPSFTDGGLVNLSKHPWTIPGHQSTLQVLYNPWEMAQRH